jgi:hypothetical protein
MTKEGYIINSYNDLVIDIKCSLSYEIYLNELNENDSQKWKFEDGYFINKLNGYVIDVFNSKTDNGSKVGGWIKNFLIKSKNQQFELINK